LLLLRLPFLNQPFGDSPRELNRRDANVFTRRGLRRMGIDAWFGSHAWLSARVIRRSKAGRRNAMIDDDRLHGILLHLRIWRQRGCARQQIARLFADNHLTFGGGEDGHQADFQLRPTDAIPRNPDAVGSTEFGGAEMAAELCAREHKLAIRLTATIGLLSRVVVAIDNQLPFDGDGLILLVVKVQATAEASSWRLAGRVEHRR
jgi:hypothetical protein